MQVMIFDRTGTARRGATMVEVAIVLPVLFLFIFGMVIGGVGVFRYQTLASLAREATRYASVHGTEYQADTGLPAVTAQKIYHAAIVPQSAGLDLDQLTYEISYNGAATAGWDSVAHSPRFALPNSAVLRTASVSVTLTYRWEAPLYFGTIDLTSTSEMPITY